MKEFNFKDFALNEYAERPFDLQMFADDGASDSGNESSTEGNESTKDSSSDTGASKDNSESKEAKYTDEDIDRIISRKFAEWERKSDKAQKAKEEADRLKNMTAQEKRELEIENMQKELASLKSERALSAMADQARAMLADSNITVSDTLVNHLISENADDTKAAVESFVKEFNSAVQKAVAERLKGKAPASNGGKNNSITKEDIMKIQNRQERQKAITEHIELFRK